MNLNEKKFNDQKQRIIQQIDFFHDRFQIELKYDEPKIDFLLENLKDAQDKIRNDKELSSNYLLSFSQFIKLNQLADILYKNNLKKSKKYIPFRTLIDKLESFFRYTNKKAWINPRGRMVFEVKGQKISPEKLSSGEQQILIFFTYLVFQGQSKNEPIMLYDEPELSLHLDWQEIFIETILELNPSIQIILATHSPPIGYKFLEKQIDVQENVN